MEQETATLRGLISALSAEDGGKALVFRSEGGDVGAGYHVTELKLADVTSIDCGGRRHQWRETGVQLLDGHGRQHMNAGKFVSIMERSAAAIPGLDETPVHFEFSPGNRGLGRYRIEGLRAGVDRIEVSLHADGAACKPAVEFAAKAGTASCCGSERVACCG